MANPIFFFKWANPGLFLFYFHSFLIIISIQIEKSIDGVLGLKPGAAGWQAQTKPRRYGHFRFQYIYNL